jgi:hypothetical protein
MKAHQPFWSLRLSAAAIILSSSITISFAGNFTPIPKNKIAQFCAVNCQNAFSLCVQLSAPPATPPPTVGTQQVTPTVPLVIGPDCQANLNLCLLSCQANPKG